MVIKKVNNKIANTEQFIHNKKKGSSKFTSIVPDYENNKLVFLVNHWAYKGA